MADISQTPPVPAASDSERGTVIIAYILFLVGWPTGHLTTLAAIILAYIKRGDVRGTIWESHYQNIITTFWVTLGLGIVFGLLCIVLVGIPLIIALGIWSLYRGIKGLIRVSENRPYIDDVWVAGSSTGRPL